MYVCVCVCIYVCMYVCMYVCVSVCYFPYIPLAIVNHFIQILYIFL